MSVISLAWFSYNNYWKNKLFKYWNTYIDYTMYYIDICFPLLCLNSKINFLTGLHGWTRVENIDQLGRKRNNPVGSMELGSSTQWTSQRNGSCWQRQFTIECDEQLLLIGSRRSNCAWIPRSQR